MSKRIFQNLIDQIKEIIDIELGITDDKGVVVACSNESKLDDTNNNITKVISDKNQTVIISGTTYQKIIIKGKIEYIAFIKSDDRQSSKYLSLLSLNIINLKLYNEDKFDKGNFIRNILTDKTAPEEILFRAKELHINDSVKRVVFYIKTDKSNEKSAKEILHSLFPNRAKDFILTPDSESIIFIKELKDDENYKDVEQIAKIIVDTIMMELMDHATVGFGHIYNNLSEIRTSFKEAKIALEVGSIFGNNRNIISYEKLGIGRLIYQLPEPLCKLFLEEIFNGCSKNFFNTEMIHTIEKFFENDLNVSEASRQLFVHRNTLVYRLEKIEKETGLDIRKFDDAIILKFAMLVKKYMESSKK